MSSPTPGPLAASPAIRSDTMGTPVSLTASATAYNPTGDNGAQRGSRRWGDYSITSLDPIDDMSMWTVQEFCDVANSYGVRIARLIAPPPATPSVPARRHRLPGGGERHAHRASSSGSGYFDPGANLPGVPAFAHLTATASNGAASGTPPTVTSATWVDPTTVNLVLNTISASPNLPSEKYTLTITNPDGQAASAAVLHVVSSGGPTVTIGPGQSQSEGNAGLVPYTFLLTMSSTVGSDVTVNYQTQDGTATAANNDYLPVSPR